VADVGNHGGLPIRSFRVVFELERRIHKVDRWRIPVPYGVPLRGLAYWAIALVVTIALARMPIAGVLIGALPTPIRLLILPVGLAYLLVRIEVDGRPAHTALATWIRWRISAPHTAALRRVPPPGTVIRLGDITLVPDERAGRYRGAVIKGPADVLLRYPPHGYVKGKRRPTFHVSRLPGPPLLAGRQVRLRAGERMVVHG
jgi:hypothetical protein